MSLIQTLLGCVCSHDGDVSVSDKPGDVPSLSGAVFTGTAEGSVRGSFQVNTPWTQRDISAGEQTGGFVTLGLPALHNRNELMQNLSGLCLSSIPHSLDARFLVLCLLTELFRCCRPHLKFQDLRGGKSSFDSLLLLLVAHHDGR